MRVPEAGHDGLEIDLGDNCFLDLVSEPPSDIVKGDVDLSLNTFTFPGSGSLTVSILPAKEMVAGSP